MSTSRQSAARAASVSRTLRAAGFGVGYRGSSRYNPLEVAGSGGQRVRVSLDESEHRARIGDIADALREAGFEVIVTAADTDPRYASLRSAYVTRSGWTA